MSEESAVSAEKQRKYVFVPFDPATCPVEGCDVAGSIPGVKRHVKQMHGQEQYDVTAWPPLRTVDGLITAFEKMSDPAVTRIAEHYGVTDPNASLEEIAKTIVGAE